MSYWGTTRRDGRLTRGSEYVKITETYPLAAAEAFSTLNDKFTFVYVSGEGATQKPGPFTMLFGIVKGRTETAINALMKTHPSLRTYSMRPAMVDAKGDPNVRPIQLQRQGGSFVYKMTDVTLGPVIRSTMTGFLSPTAWLGKVLVEMAIGDGEKIAGSDVEGDGRIVPNKAARRVWKDLL